MQVGKKCSCPDPLRLADAHCSIHGHDAILAAATPSIFDTGPSKQCSECKSWFTGEHFCWGTYPG